MSKPQEKSLTYEMVIAENMSKATGPLPTQELTALMLSALPSSARNPKQAMRQHIRHATGRQLVFLDADTVLPLRLAMQGARFRLKLERSQFERGFLQFGQSLQAYLPLGFSVETVKFVDQSGKPISAKMITNAPAKSADLLALIRLPDCSASLGAWFREQKMYVKDHVLVTILNWEQGVLQLRREPFGQQNPTLLAERNRQLADMLFDLLENASRESIYVHEALPTVYARMPDKDVCPPNAWADIIAADNRMKHDGWQIFYGDKPPTMFEKMLGVEQPHKRRPTVMLSKDQAQLIYRFKVCLAHKPRLWREIEIQGKQTLADLDSTLREGFNHDVFDHMSGFWKLIPRAAQAKTMSRRSSGRAARTREVAIGDVEPMGGGDGARIKVAELSLAVGEQLKYVYDFGDWIEHQLTLQAIEAPQNNIKYPREVARNQPEYAFCVECQKKGKQQVAKWICLECTTGPEQEILLCEKCADKHEDHYLEEILY